MAIQTLPSSIALSPELQTLLQEGCYVLRYQGISSSTVYDGTMRMERNGATLTGSGDLYLSRNPVDSLTSVSEIPIFPIDDYRYYLQITNITATSDDSFILEFERFRFDKSINDLITQFAPSLLRSFGISTDPWISEGIYTAQMDFTSTPSGDLLIGQVQNRFGQTEGTLTTMWVSDYLRRAILEIDRVSGSELPTDSGDGITWTDIFDNIGWNLTVIESNFNLTEPSGEFWSDGEMHAAMLNWKDSTDLDSQWLYHLICVRRLDSTSRGIMYDAYGSDSNNIPREGAGISSHWVIPNENPWGKVKGVRFGQAKAPYFRTAVHEMGHALGLYHNTIDNGVMNTTEVIADNAVFPTQFPDNIKWTFAFDDQKRLRHLPDMWVRPGGTPFGQFALASDHNDATDHIESVPELILEVSPTSEIIPMGAPVRIEIALKNTSDHSVKVPSQVSLKAENVKGQVIDPSGNIRTFQPLIMCMDTVIPLDDLSPNDQKTHSETLLRGGQGALFPMSGVHRIMVDVEWEEDEKMMKVTGETFVMVTPPVDDAHAKAALKILSTPDTLLTLVIGGDHLKEGLEALNMALDNEILAPHYQMIEAKRLSKKFGKRAADYKKACECLCEQTVMSQSEKQQAKAIKKTS